VDCALLIVAVVTDQSAATAVNGQSCIAAATFSNPAALVAEQGRRKATAVEKNQHLLFFIDGFPDGAQCRAANTAFKGLCLEVDNSPARR